MKKLIPLSLPLASLTVALSAPVFAAEECYLDACSKIEAVNSCVAAGETTELTIQGALSGATGWAVTSYQLIADAEWSYTPNHMVQLTGGTAIDNKGTLFGSSVKKTLTITGGDAKSYTFIFGDRRFGKDYYDVAVDLPMGSGGGTAQQLQIDIKPGSCPNPLNMGQKGITPVAIVGTADLDIRSLDPYKIRLEGVAPVKYAYEDIATAIPKSSVYDCTTSLGDGMEDLSLKFITQDLAKAIEEKTLEGRMPHDGEVVTLTLTIEDDAGENSCGGGYSGQDVVKALVKGKNK